MMRSLKSTVFVIATLLLSACSMIQEKHIDGQSISNSEGIVVTNLISNTDEVGNIFVPHLKYIAVYQGESNDAGVSKNVEFTPDKNGDHNIFKLPVGHYKWWQIVFGNHYFLLDRNEGFEVKENTVTYIGDLKTIIDYGFMSISAENDVIDKQEEITKFLLNNYPKLMSESVFEKKLTILESI